MNVSLPRALKEFVEKRYDTGRYASKSEIIHEGLRRLMDEDDQYRIKLEALRNAIQVGRESGPGAPLDIDDILAEVEAEKSRQK